MEMGEEKIKELLQKWSERLLDLSVSNPLMDLNRSRVARLRIVHPSLETLVQLLYDEGKELNLPASIMNNNLESGEILFEETDFSKKLRRIYRNSKVSLEERGLPTLHIILGTLLWEDRYRLGKARTPLLLLPCAFEARSALTPMKLKATDDEIIINPALKLYLHEIYRADLPELPDDSSCDDVRNFLQELSSRIQTWGTDWTVEPEVWLTTLSFDSFVLYHDLKVLESRALTHPLIAGFAGLKESLSKGFDQRDAVLHEQDLGDKHLLDEPMLFVLPADSSQREALILARKGKNLIIHGPPGTGKSQTITNLIADFLWRGKTVLFVSAKMAALDVVHKRLQDLGLDRFCLELYSAKANKTKVIEDLKRTLSLASSEPLYLTERWKELLDRLKACRAELDGYVSFLHEKRSPIGLSLYEVLGRLEALKNIPSLDCSLPWSDPLNVTQEAFGEVIQALSDLCDRAEIFEKRAEHPWRGFTPLGQVDSFFIENSLKIVTNGAVEIESCIRVLEPFVWATDKCTLHEIYNCKDDLAALLLISEENGDLFKYSADTLEQCYEVAKKLLPIASELEVLVARHYELWNVSPQDLTPLLMPIKNKFAGFSSFLQRDYWKWRKHVSKFTKPGAKTSRGVLHQSLRRAERIVQLNNALFKGIIEIQNKLGRDIASERRALESFVHDLHIVLNWKRKVNNEDDRSAEFQAIHKNALVKVIDVLSSGNFQNAIKQINELWPGGFVQGRRCEDVLISELIKRCHEILAAMNQYFEWVDLYQVMQRCTALGLQQLLDRLPRGTAHLADKIFIKRFYEIWVRSLFEKNPEKSKYTSATFEKIREEFRRLDAQVREAWLAFVKAKAAEPGVRVAKADPSYGALTEVGILRREIQKTRKYKPLRKLFAEIPHVLRALKPCFLMSPLSVSAFLDPDKFVFDVVIFDEASQIPTHEAIPAILRGRQVIVAGDTNQLPPTSFFKASFIWEIVESEDEYEELGSFLEECIATPGAFAEVHLRWHYRSRDERLIAFSNHYFYRDNPLLTFPYPAINSPDTGIRLEYLPHGVWDRGKTRTNRAEAEKVAQLVNECVRRNPNRSLGVVAVNAEQCELIEEFLEKIFEQYPEIRQILYNNESEPFFVKSIENVQGDERDVIIISLGFGKDQNGVLYHNFGPIGQENGWRRLNVLITRARWQIILVTSIRSYELSGINPNNRGALSLRAFLEYVERGCRLPAPLPRIIPSETNPFEDSVAEAIRALGYQVDQQVGVGPYRIDIAVRDPRDNNRYLAAVECDGATYHSTPDARDRDIIREEMLKALGWRILRVWSTDWFWRREKTMSYLKNALEDLLKTPLEQSVQAVPTNCDSNCSSSDSRESAQTESGLSRTITLKYPCGQAYQKYKELGYREILLYPSQSVWLSRQILKILEVEGPIHKSTLIERLKEINNVSRVGKNILANIEYALAKIKNEIEIDSEKFIRLKGKTTKNFRTPGDGVHRPLQLIAADEIKFAVLHVVEEQFSCSREVIGKAVARLFGWERTSEAVEKRVQKIVDELIAERKLRENNGWVSLAD